MIFIVLGLGIGVFTLYDIKLIDFILYPTPVLIAVKNNYFYTSSMDILIIQNFQITNGIKIFNIMLFCFLIKTYL